MYVSRRHYRRLLLPLGWVALGFSLLLGCQLLLRNSARLLPKNVLQLTMPVLEKIAKKPIHTAASHSFSKPLASLKTATYWQDAFLSGNPLSDSVNKARAEAMVRAMQADQGHARGVRIYLRRAATYGNLVSLLDMMIRLDQPKYWLDIEHQPVTFYVVNE